MGPRKRRRWGVRRGEAPRSYMLLEIIACTLTDAIEAERGGAGRLELVRDLGKGGLTPSLEIVQEVRDAVRIPIRVMIRETYGYQAGGAAALDRLASLAVRATSLGVDGIVVGFLQGQRIDARAMDAIAAASPVPTTFHHAFDELPDPEVAIRSLSQWPRIDRVLTSSGPGRWTEKRARLDRLGAVAPPGIVILAGGGVDGAALRALAESSIREAHVGRAARVPPTVDGTVSSHRVASLVEAAQR